MNDSIFNRFLIETLYLRNTNYGLVFKSVPANKETKTPGKYFVRYPGKPEIEITNKQSDLPLETFDMGDEITEEEYRNF